MVWTALVTGRRTAGGLGGRTLAGGKPAAGRGSWGTPGYTRDMAPGRLPGRVLVVDDDPGLREGIAGGLDPARWVVAQAEDGAEALTVAKALDPEVILLDLGLPDVRGLDLIPHFRQLNDLVGVVVLTGTSDISVVVEAMRLGADNFLVKPVHLDHLEEVLERTLAERRRQRRHRAMATRLEERLTETMVGSSRAMVRVRQLIAQVAETDATVLLLGESGTGKGLAAEEIHRLSRRGKGPFLDLNCAGLSAQLLESELFGHEAGAFTDARRPKPGLLEVASGGTVFLDEIAEMPVEVQSKLLKVLEDKRFRRLGGVRDIRVDVRLVVATNRDLKRLVADGKFRRDLYYRLNVFAIEIPPLRERRDDILELAGHFLARLNRSMGTSVEGFSAEAETLLTRYPWPGNIRELRNVVERAMILARSGRIEPHHLPSDVMPFVGPGGRLCSLEDVEREHIAATLQATGGNIKRAAEVLGISRTTLYAKMRRYGLNASG